MQFGILSYRITVCFISVILFHYMWVLVVLFSTFLKLRCYGSFSAIVVREVRYSSTCLLTRLSGSRGSWPRNKSRIGPFPNGFGWKLVIKSGTTPRGDIGEEPNWVHKESHMTLEKKQTGSVRKGTSEMSHIFMLYSCCLPLEVTEKRPPLSGQFGSLLGIGLFFSWYFSFSSRLVH